MRFASRFRRAFLLAMTAIVLAATMPVVEALGNVFDAAAASCAFIFPGIVDGTFESGSPWPSWTVQTSTNFGTPVCDVPSCGTGGGAAPPFAGGNWVWFGGIPAPEASTLGKSVTLPIASSLKLRFKMRIGTVTTPFNDTLKVSIDGTILQTFTEPSVAEPGYTDREIDLAAYANGASHAVLFRYDGPTSGTGSFVVDNVALCTVLTFTNDPLVPGGTSIKAVHINELRTRIDAQRMRFGLSGFAWTGGALSAGMPVLAINVSDLRTALQQAYTQAGLAPPIFTDTPLLPGTTVIQALHINQLRNALVTLEAP